SIPAATVTPASMIWWAANQEASRGRQQQQSRLASGPAQTQSRGAEGARGCTIHDRARQGRSDGKDDRRIAAKDRRVRKMHLGLRKANPPPVGHGFCLPDQCQLGRLERLQRLAPGAHSCSIVKKLLDVIAREKRAMTAELM